MIMKECYVGSMSKGEVSANGTTFNESNVTANKDLSFASGNDTNIKGGKLSGEKVTGNVGGGLNIESKQDSNSYKENNKSVGASVGLGSNKAAARWRWRRSWLATITLASAVPLPIRMRRRCARLCSIFLRSCCCLKPTVLI